MEDTVVTLATDVGVRTRLLPSRPAGIETSGAEELAAPLDELTRPPCFQPRDCPRNGARSTAPLEPALL